MSSRSAIYSLIFARQALRHRRGEPAPLVASLFITARCTSKCPSCFFYRNFSFEPTDMDKHLAIRCTEQIAECGVPICFLGGGEPLMYPNLVQVVESLRKHWVMPVLFTNGLLVSNENTRMICRLFTHVFVSIDGNKEVNDQRRGRGSYEKAVNAVRMLREADRNARVFVRCTVARENMAGLVEFVNEMMKVGATGVSLHLDCHPETLPRLDATTHAGAVLRQAKSRFGRFILEDQAQVDLMIEYLKTRRTPVCAASKLGHISILPDGTVSACCLYPLPIGSLVDQELPLVLRRMHAVELPGTENCHGCCRADFCMMNRIESGTWRGLAGIAISSWRKAWSKGFAFHGKYSRSSAYSSQARRQDRMTGV